MKLSQRNLVFAVSGTWLTASAFDALCQTGKFPTGTTGVAFKRIRTVGSPGAKVDFAGGKEIELTDNDFGTEDIIIDEKDVQNIEITCPEITATLFYKWLAKNPADLDDEATFKSGKGSYIGVSRLESGVGLYLYPSKYDKENLTDDPLGVTGTSPNKTFVTSNTGLPPFEVAHFFPCVIFERTFTVVGQGQDGMQIVTMKGKPVPLSGSTSKKVWFDGPLYKSAS